MTLKTKSTSKNVKKKSQRAESNNYNHKVIKYMSEVKNKNSFSEST